MSADATLAQVRVVLPDDPHAALALLEPLWAASAGSPSPELVLAMAETLHAVGDPARLVEVADQVAAATALPSPAQARLLHLRWMSANTLRQFDGLEAAEQQAGMLQAVDDVDGVAKSHLSLTLGSSRLFQGQPARAEAAYRHGLTFLDDGDHANRRVLLQNLAVALAQQARVPEAIQAFADAERAIVAQGRTPSASFLGNIGSLYLDAKDFERASDYLARALAASEGEQMAPATEVRLLNSLGVARDGLGDPEGAARYFERVLQITRDNQLPAGMPLNNLGYARREAGSLREALALFEESLSAYEQDGDPAGTSVALKNIGETWVALGDRIKAADYLERAYRGYLAADIRPRRLELYPVLIANLEALGRTAKALEYLHEFKALSDETINVESNERIARLESAIDLAARETQLAASEAERLQQEASLVTLRAAQREQRLVAVALGGGLLAALLVALLLYRQVRFKSRAHRMLLEKNTEIEAQHARLVELNETVRQQSVTDALTGLPNRRFLEQHMAELGQCQVRASDSAAARGLLLMIDIDHFKRINDAYGHVAGDRALMLVADALRACQGPNDVVVRWGGEEFLWLAHGATLDAAPALCNGVQDALRERPFDHRGGSHPITVSIGFAPRPLWPIEGDDWTLSLRVADDALYLAKSSGRDRWVGYAPGSAPQLPLEQGVLASALEARGHLVRVEADRFEPAALPG